MAGNRNLNTAARAKKDKFYTQLEDIENELWHYRHHFKDKIVLCNCDDPYESDFFKYFTIYFNTLGLKKLIATCYAGSPIVQTELDFWGTANENPTFDKRTQAIRLDVAEVRDFNGDGDFRSAECVAALKEADIVVTNPPFSLFREYVAQLIEYDKKFVIIGNKNALTYKEIFPLIMQNKIWVGFMPMSREIYFDVPQSYIDEGLDAGKDRSIVIHDGRHMVRSQSIWFTNFDISKFREDIPLYKKYSPDLYPRYDNYDAIEVGKTAEIPEDYFGVMGVPITFLDKYNPAQFEILGCTYSYGDCGCHVDGTSWGAKINGKDIYKRLFIRRR